MNNFGFQINIKLFTNPIGKLNETKKTMDINTDICKFLRKKNRGNPFNGYLTNLIHKFGKIPHCPMKPVSFSYFHLLHDRNRTIIFRDTIISIIWQLMDWRFPVLLGICWEKVIWQSNLDMLPNWDSELSKQWTWLLLVGIEMGNKGDVLWDFRSNLRKDPFFLLRIAI